MKYKSIIFIIIAFLFLNIIGSGSVNINSSNIVYNISVVNVSFLSNQSYDSISYGINYINLSYNSTQYINYSIPLINSNRIEYLFSINGTYMIPSGVVTINGINYNMSYTNSLLYYDLSALPEDIYIIESFNFTDIIGIKRFTINDNVLNTITIINISNCSDIEVTIYNLFGLLLVLSLFIFLYTFLVKSGNNISLYMTFLVLFILCVSITIPIINSLIDQVCI